VWAQLFVVAFNLVPSVVDRTAHTVLARLFVLPAKDCAVVFLMSPPTLACESSRSLGLLVVLAALLRAPADALTAHTATRNAGSHR
jgi:hypothetical protein